MAGKILSVEISHSVTRVLEMDYKANTPKVYNSFCFNTPVDILNDGIVTVNDTFLSLFRQKITEKGIKTRKAVFTISSSRVASRDVTVPLVKESRINSLLTANSAEYFPVDLTQYELAYRIVDKIDTKEAKQYKLVVFAVPKDIITSYHEAAKQLGLELEALDYEGNSVCQLMRRTMKGDVLVTIKVDEKSSMITILKDNKVELQRVVGYGLDEAVEVVRDSGLCGDNASFTDAVDFMRRKTCMYRHLASTTEIQDEERLEEAIEGIRNEVTMAFRALVNNLVRVIDYYLSRNGGMRIEKIVLIGLGADCSGLSKLMTNELGIKVSASQNFTEVNFNRDLKNDNFYVSEYVNCIGASFQPLSFQMGMETKAGKKHGNTDSSLLIPAIVCGGCVLASAILIAGTLFVHFSLKSSNSRLESSIASMQDAQKTYDTYVQTKMNHDDVSNMLSLTATANDQVLLFLSEMESDMPSDIIVDNLTATEDGVSMSLTTGSKESAAKIMMQLRKFESLGTPVTSGLSEDTDDNGVSTVSFSVTATYAADDEAATETDAAQPKEDATAVTAE